MRHLISLILEWLFSRQHINDECVKEDDIFICCCEDCLYERGEIDKPPYP